MADRDGYDERLRLAQEKYIASHPVSHSLHQQATVTLPGGNTRSVLDMSPFPFKVESAEGSHLTDVDGHRYLDLLGNYTAGLLGHSPQAVRDAIHAAVDNGWAYGATHANEARFAALLCERFPSLDQVRFTNSGTEANLMAIASAKHVTGRSKVLVFEGGYHGGVLYFGPTGKPLAVPHEFVTCAYNDIDAVNLAFAEHGNEIACALIEPMLGSGGCIPGDPAFLQTLRDRCTEVGTILIFDEVMTSRLSIGGAQAELGITPDLTTLGKYLAGGMSFGAFGGRHDIMSIFDPSAGEALSHGGTFNNNVLTMAAGVATVSELLTEEALYEVNARGDRLRHALNGVFESSEAPLHVTGWGSLMNVHADDAALKELFFLDLLEAGYYTAPRGFVALSFEVSDEDVDGFIAATTTWCDALRT